MPPDTATPVNRRAALILAKSGITDIACLTALLRGTPAPEDRPWPDPTLVGPPRLPRFPDQALPGWIGIYVRAEARATQTPADLAGMLALARRRRAGPDPRPRRPHPPAPSPLSVPERGLGGEVSFGAVESAIQIAEYLIEHAKAAYAAMGLDPVVANTPALLDWIRRTGRLLDS